ncbi:MAG: GNAT family N-acetyltransferase [Anaerolineaceae bacterium]|jgi:ribosomal protein S18 acetylase RimI-like enzyme|nr:GNAT family N-acetyltransferase [Anaerolineaceae bacterium]MDD4043034.1 GNAT family N-acetyltransferase [Anaerolineaceae bacterium]MDD4577288.1 GNAT family N-acetyltransferase [Anaerolineaceae bacterium]
MTIEFRPAEQTDIPFLAKARLDFLRALGQTLPEDELDGAQSQIEGFLETRLNEQIFAWIGIVDDKPAAVGFLQVYNVMYHPHSQTGRNGRIINILTWSEYRNQGLARGIMERLVALACELELDYVALDASPEGRHLYESLGFVELPPQVHPPMTLIL